MLRRIDLRNSKYGQFGCGSQVLDYTELLCKENDSCACADAYGDVSTFAIASTVSLDANFRCWTKSWRKENDSDMYCCTLSYVGLGSSKLLSAWMRFLGYWSHINRRN